MWRPCRSATLAQIEVIKAAGAEDHATARWSGAHNRYLAAAQELGERSVLPDLLPGLLITVGNAAVTIVGLIGVIRGRLYARRFRGSPDPARAGPGAGRHHRRAVPAGRDADR